jgi:hypothetical protein
MRRRKTRLVSGALSAPLGLLFLLAGCPEPPVATDDAGNVDTDPILIYDSGPGQPAADGGVAIGDGGNTPAADAGPPQVGVDSVSPPAGPLNGGNRVRIEGFGFAPPPPDGDQRVFFGDHEATNCLLLPGGRSMTCQVPPGDDPGPISVRVENALGIAEEENLYTYFSPVTLHAVDPPSGSVEGGTAVTLTGEGFNDEMVVLFGGRQVADVVVADDGLSATARTPPGIVGRVDVEALDTFGRSELELAFEYVSELALDAVEPAAAYVGDVVDLRGAGFGDGIAVAFDTTSADVDTLVDDSRARVVVPALSPGSYDVTVSAGGVSRTLVDAFVALAAPVGGTLALDAVVPAVGDAAGGSTHLIAGEGFTNVDGVTLGGTAVTSFEVLDDRRLRVVAPAGAVGPAQIEVSTTDLGSATLDGFSYAVLLAVESIDPASGPSEGGTEVTINGRGFADGVTVALGGAPLDAVVVAGDGLSLTGTTSPGTPGEVDVVVTLGDERARLADAFVYETDLSVLGVLPVRGSMSGGTWVTISGEGFDRAGDLTVLFGELPASDVTVVSDSKITGYSPFNLPGVVDVTVTIGSDSAIAERAFTYFDPTFLVGGTRGGPIDGAVYLTALDAFTGMPIEGLVAFLGTEGEGEHMQVTNIVGQATLSGPGVVGPQTVSVAGDGYEYASLIDVNASEVTLYLQPLSLAPPTPGPPPPPPPPATIRGRVFGFAKEFFDPAALGPDEIALAVVVTTARDEFSGTPNPGGQNIVFQEGGEYFIANSRPGRVALVALAGIFNLATGEFRMRQMGVRRNVFPELGVDLIDQDITLTIPLDQEVDLSLPDAPVGIVDGPTITRVIPFLRFGGEGSLAYTDAVDTTRNHLLDTMPDVPGEMLTFIAGAYTTDGDFGLIKDDGTAGLVEGERMAFGDGTTWAEPDPFTGLPLVDGNIFVVTCPDGTKWATNVVAAQSQTEMLLEDDAPCTGEDLEYHVGSPTLPSSEVVQDGVGDLIGGVTIQPVLGLPEPLSPLRDGVLENRTLRWKAAPGQAPTNHLAYVYDPFAFSVLWTFYIDGSRTKVPIPRIPFNVGELDVENVPKDMALGGYAWQHLSMYTPGFDYQNFSYIELGTRARRAWTTDFLFFIYPGD